ncbi:MAG TPA: DUF2206 domain-containing protein [Methanobacterium sp.]|nr:DUF2206 domain-containing protein [Methanobacterium sp.]
MLALVGLQFYNINIPILGQFITFIYLTFIPGFLILRILKLHELDNVKTIIFSVGLSIVSLMFIGFLMNMLYPLIGIYNPISLLYLVLTITGYVLILCIISYLMDRNFSNPSVINTETFLSSKFLFLCILPFMAIFGSYFVNYYENNLISMFLILLLGVTLFLVVFNVIPKKLYPFTIWIISISLLFMSSLISTYVWGWDIQNEYFLANLVLKNSYWNYALFDAYNSMLSIVMLSPIYAIITNMSLDWVLKIIFPFFFSLIPLGLYNIFKNQINNQKIAFAAVFLFISFNTFYIEMLSLTREITAELFLIAMLLLIFNKKFKANLVILFLLMGIGLAVSHYSTNFFFLFALIFVTVIISLFNLFTKDITLNKDLIVKIITVPFIIIFLILFTDLWYSSFSQGNSILALLNVFNSIMPELSKKVGLTQETFINVIMVILFLVFMLLFVYFIKYRHNKHGSKIYEFIFGIQLLIKKRFNYKVFGVISIVILVAMAFLTGPLKTWIVSVLRYLNFDMIFFILTGLIISILYFNKNKFQKEYLAFSILAAGMLLAGIAVPSFEASFNMSRIYEISFLFLAPFCVIGALKIIEFIYIVIKKDKIGLNGSIKIFSVFLVIFLFFNAGFFSVLSNQSVPMHLSGENSASDYHPRFDHQEVLGAQWLSENRVNAKIFADVYAVFVFYRFIAIPNEISANNGVYGISNYDSNNSYIYLRKLNQDNNLLVGFTSRTNRNRVYEDMSSIINPKNRIYENGASKIYYG